MPGAKLYGPNVRVPPAHLLPTCQVFYADFHLKNTVIATEWFSQDSALDSRLHVLCSLWGSASKKVSGAFC